MNIMYNKRSIWQQPKETTAKPNQCMHEMPTNLGFSTHVGHGMSSAVIFAPKVLQIWTPIWMFSVCHIVFTGDWFLLKCPLFAEKEFKIVSVVLFKSKCSTAIPITNLGWKIMHKKMDSSWFKGSWLIWISESNFLAFRTLNIPIIPWHYDWIICAFSEPCSSWKKNPNYECKLAGNLNHPLDNMFFCQNWIPSPQCVSGICFNKTNLSKFQSTQIWNEKNLRISQPLQVGFFGPRIQGTKSHIGQWDQPAGGMSQVIPFRRPTSQ